MFRVAIQAPIRKLNFFSVDFGLRLVRIANIPSKGNKRPVLCFGQVRNELDVIPRQHLEKKF
jgi:hypothetical protein